MALSYENLDDVRVAVSTQLGGDFHIVAPPEVENDIIVVPLTKAPSVDARKRLMSAFEGYDGARHSVTYIVKPGANTAYPRHDPNFS